MSTTPVIPEPIQQQMDKTKYYVPSDDDPNMAAVKKAGGIAYQDQTDPGVVAIVDPKADNMQAVLGHEAYHAMVANMPPTEAAKIPQDDYSDPLKTYDVNDEAKWRAEGKTITNLPQEKAARIIEHYIKGDQATRKQLQPWIDDLNSMKQSTVEPNRPGMVDINTAVRPPAGGQQMLQNIKPAMPDVADQWKKLNSQQRDLALSRMSPEQKQKLASSLGFKGGEETQKPLAPRKPEERTVGNYAREIAGGVGRGVADDVTGLYQTVRHPIDTAKGLVKQAGTAATEAGKEFRDTKGAPLGQRLGAAALTGLENAPMIGGMVQHAEEGGEQMGSPEAAGAAAEGITAFAAPEVAGKALKLAPRAAEAVTGTGPRAIKDLVKDTQEANAKIADANAKIRANREAEVQTHGDKVATAKAQADLRSGLATRKAALERGVNTLSDKFHDDLKAVRDDAAEKANAKYTSLNAALAEETIPSQSLLGHLLDASEKIKGSMTNPTIFKDIEKAVTGGETISYDDLQGYYSELGRELSKGTLPGDIYTAYSTLQDAIGGEMQKVADSKGLGAQLTDARGSWRNLKQTFYDPKSPLRKALNSKEPGTAVKAIIGKDRTGIEALAKYDPQLASRANVLRGYQEEADGIRIPQASTKATPKLAPKKELAPAKKIGEEDIREAKGEHLQKSADRIRHYSTAAATWPLFYAVRDMVRGHAPNLGTIGLEMAGTAALGHGLANILEKPAVKDFLTKATSRDIATIPEDLRRDMPSIVKAAQGKGIKVSPLLVRSIQGTAFLAPRKEQHPTDAWATNQ